VSVAGAVIRDGRVLAIRRRDNHHWEPPGGVLEMNETIEDGLRREIKEETGLDVEPLRLTGVYKNIPRGIVSLVFACQVTGGQLITDKDETTDARWLTADEIRELMDEAFAIRLLDALDDGPPAIRNHNGLTLTVRAPRGKH
jgi:ADP-ribose pyrophosphatase YjhB (NUDIX family)